MEVYIEVLTKGLKVYQIEKIEDEIQLKNIERNDIILKR